MNRRTLLATLAALPLCGWMKPKDAETGSWLVSTCDSGLENAPPARLWERKSYGFVDVEAASRLGLIPCLVCDADGRHLKDCRSFNDETGEVTCCLLNEKGRKYLSPDMTLATKTFTAKLPLRIERIANG